MRMLAAPLALKLATDLISSSLIKYCKLTSKDNFMGSLFIDLKSLSKYFSTPEIPLLSMSVWPIT